ncbi:MAG: hypothetical protein FJ312_07950 [SAR202 cluster bacterium]|nr:hypothetical protein [SAR202 cluster bacterium]
MPTVSGETFIRVRAGMGVSPMVLAGDKVAAAAVGAGALTPTRAPPRVRRGFAGSLPTAAADAAKLAVYRRLAQLGPGQRLWAVNLAAELGLTLASVEAVLRRGVFLGLVEARGRVLYPDSGRRRQTYRLSALGSAWLELRRRRLGPTAWQIEEMAPTSPPDG